MQYSNIFNIAKENDFFRKVIFTNKFSQLVVMSLLEGEDIGMETHHDVDQILVFVQGKGNAIVGGEEQVVNEGDVVVVPAGIEHNFINSGPGSLKLFTVYSPPEHKDGTVHQTKAEAEKSEE